MIKDLIAFVTIFIVICCVSSLTYYKGKPTIQDICRSYGIECNVVIYNEGIPNNTNNIYVHKYFKDNFTDEELLPVLLHELGHKVLGHTARRLKEEALIRKTTGRDVTPTEVCTIRREFETEADIFSQMVLKQYKIDNNLEGFFTKALPKEVMNKETCTHPAPISRIQLLRKLK